MKKSKVDVTLTILVTAGVLTKSGENYGISQEFDLLFRGHLILELRNEPNVEQFNQTLTNAYVETLDDFGLVNDNVDNMAFMIDVIRTFEPEGKVEKIVKLLGK